MNTCERCHEPMTGKERAPVPVDYGETHIVICYPCAVEMTYIIGAWLGTEPMDDPHAWLKSISP